MTKEQQLPPTSAGRQARRQLDLANSIRYIGDGRVPEVRGATMIGYYRSRRRDHCGAHRDLVSRTGSKARQIAEATCA